LGFLYSQTLLVLAGYYFPPTLEDALHPMFGARVALTIVSILTAIFIAALTAVEFMPRRDVSLFKSPRRYVREVFSMN